MNMTRPLMPLTNDKNKLLTRVGELTGFGMTYVLNGVIWGWHALSPEAPLEEALEDGQALKYLVIFSDGYNTKMATDAPRGSPEFGKTMAAAAQADTEMESACTLVKQDGIEVFVIYYAVNSDESFKSKLKSCAATASNYKEPELNALGSIMKAFNEVKRQINNNIRLTQ
jgi:hypothetical protein